MISPRRMEVSGDVEEVGSGDSMLVYTMRQWCIGSLVVVRISGDEQPPRWICRHRAVRGLV